MEVTVKNENQNQQHGYVVIGTLKDGCVIVRGKYSAIVIKSGTSYCIGDGWCTADAPTNMKLYPVGTEITIKV
jgi:hypothetical protein